MPGDARRVLVLGTRGLKARHRHLLRDLQRLMPHGQPGSKLAPEDGLSTVCELCEASDCGAALLLDARDPRRLYMWSAGCPDGPSAMFRVLNVHTVSELKFEARRCAGVRNLLSFDRSFEASSDRRVLKALLTRAFAVPRSAVAVRPSGVHRVKHAIAFSWVDGRIFVRFYRINEPTHEGVGMDVEEIGPRFVLQPVRIIASGFGGAVLASFEGEAAAAAEEEQELDE